MMPALLSRHCLEVKVLQNIEKEIWNMKSIFTNKPNWYKGNLHIHTTLSDGQKDPSDVIKLYQKAGYDFLALTDHRKPGKEGTYKNMILIPGAEWDYGNNDEYPVYHILSIGTEDTLGLLPYYEDKRLPNRDGVKPQEIINRIREAGGLAFLAHPAWSVMNPAEIYSLKGLTGTEIFNSVSRIPWNADRADSSIYFDMWAARGLCMPCIAADDSHFYQGEETKGFVMVNADELTTMSIMEALRDGNFYASQGPKFTDVRYDAEKAEITCSEDVTQIIVYSNTAWVDERVFDNPKGKVLYRFSPLDRYIRVELIDGKGRKAWCSPFLVI